MKFLIMSDLHMEFWRSEKFPFELPPVDSYDAVILAGDIGPGVKGMYAANKIFCETLGKEVFYVMGNHEFYHYDYDRVISDAIEFADNHDGMNFLHNSGTVRGDVAIFGGTMWTNFISPDGRTQEENIMMAKSMMNDFNVVLKDGRLLHPLKTVEFHNEFCENLFLFAATYINKDVLVISHHLPSYKCVHPKWQNDSLNSAFASEVPSFGAKNWVFGHTHEPVDFLNYESDCRYICNPYGYRGYEVNSGFKPDLILEM
jgi:predicted phosphodiesterase